MGKCYCCTDLHGFYELYEQINNSLNPEDKVYYLGDAGDRGPESWKLIKAILTNSQWEYIRGNHDDMLINAYEEQILEHENDVVAMLHGYMDNTMILYQNGGSQTLFDLMNEDNSKAWIGHMKKLPYYLTYVNIQGKTCYLSHSGCWHPEEEFSDYDIIWNRNHICEIYDKENCFLIGGHTPQYYLEKKLCLPPPVKPGALFYGGNKINLDLGTYRTGAAILFDLDTFESQVFYVNKQVSDGE